MSLFDNVGNFFANPLGVSTYAGRGLSIVSGNQQSFDYQKELNDKMMEREDTAYQRAVADAKAAGLSPLSVNGGASANSMSAARIDNSGTLGAALGFASQIGNLRIESRRAKADEELKAAQADYYKQAAGLTGAKTEYQKLANDLYPALTDATIEQKQAMADYAKKQTWYLGEKNSRETEYVAKLCGVSDAQIANLDARTKETLSLIMSKLSNMDEDTLLKTAQRLNLQEHTEILNVNEESARTALKYLEDNLLADLDIKLAESDLKDAERAALITKATTGILGVLLQGALAVGGMMVNPSGMFRGSF